MCNKNAIVVSLEQGIKYYFGNRVRQDRPGGVRLQNVGVRVGEEIRLFSILEESSVWKRELKGVASALGFIRGLSLMHSTISKVSVR